MRPKEAVPVSVHREPQGAMAETDPGAVGTLNTLLCSATAGFAFGQAALFAVDPSVTDDDLITTTATHAARGVGIEGVGGILGCIMFTVVLATLGAGFLLAATVMKLWAKVGARSPWLVGATTGASVVVGAAGTGVLTGILPPKIYMAAQGVLVLLVYAYSSISDMTTALLIIFTTLYVSVLYGRVGFLTGILSMGTTFCVLYAIRKALTQIANQRPQSRTRCQLLERIFFYSVFVAILGFSVGLGVQNTGLRTEKQVFMIMESVQWVVFLSAGLLGAGLGTVATVSLGPEMAGKVSLAVAVTSTVVLEAIVQFNSPLEVSGSMNGALGVATAAGVSLGAAGVAAKQAFGSRHTTLVVLGSVVGGVILAMLVLPLTEIPLATSELITITLVAVLAFFLGAPGSPFNTEVNLRRGLLTGPELIMGIGMETVTAAAEPIGAGALGAAALATAALGKLGTVGVVVAVLFTLGSTLSGKVGKSPRTINVHRD